MDQFPSNSHTSKNQKPLPDSSPDTGPQITQIISGKVEIKKPSGWSRLRRSLVAGDANTVREHVIWNVMLPAARDAVWNMGQTTLQMLLYGQNTVVGPGNQQAPRSGIGSNSRFNYGGISAGGGQPLMMQGHQQQVQQPEPYVDRTVPNQFIVSDMVDAEILINKMREIIGSYTVVTVANVYRIFGTTPTYIHSKWGWRHLEDHEFQFKRNANGGVLVTLADPEALD